MTKVLLTDTKTSKERSVSRREAAVFTRLLPRGRYLTRDMQAAADGASLQPPAAPLAPVHAPAAAPLPVAGAAEAKKKPGRPKKTEQQ
ncbi:hypothetical protein [Pseudorhodoferax sp. Leaf274]|uniref:hypothetical protein n=1 Tax=Pseudorhodoferax sp. Leaf274 TaxID=1736318 RepID=UPI0007029888|nr:hypothetical protein [Pseudorhodoferax sp. Leaf274]KQP43918.1 hypothetical protein ASF44_28740 [Pseudorhodoferax sp. Leaf274]